MFLLLPHISEVSCCRAEDHQIYRIAMVVQVRTRLICFSLDIIDPIITVTSVKRRCWFKKKSPLAQHECYVRSEMCKCVRVRVCIV